MSQFTPVFGASAAFHSEGAVTDPGPVAGTSRFLREDAVFAVPSAGPPGPPPPAPGPALDQWACNAAGYIIYDLCYKLVKSAIDTNFLTLAINAIIGFSFDALAGILIPLEIVDTAFLTWLENWVAAQIVPNIATFEAHILDQVLWSKFHCFLYNEIRTAGTVSNTVLLSAGLALSASSISPSLVANAVGLILQQFGVMTVGPVPASAFVQNYDCSTCAGSGTSSAPIPIQSGFDLRITDGTNTASFVDIVQTNLMTVVGSGNTGTLTPNFSTASSPGVNQADERTIQVNGSGIYAVVNGSLATVSLDQLGSADSHVAAGVNITGLVVGQAYALQSSGGPWDPSFPSSFVAYSWQVSTDGGTTWQNIYEDDTINPTPPTFFIPSWAITCEPTDGHHARLIWVAAATSIRFRAAGTSPSIAHGNLGFQLLDVVFEGSQIRFDSNGVKQAVESILDFVDSGTITWSLTDDQANQRVQVSATAGSIPGVVTSVGVSVPSDESVTGSPVTGSGTIAITRNSQAANKLLASPDGSSGVPAYRSLVVGDLPSSGVAAGTYGGASAVGQFTVDAEGRITAASNVGISGGGGAGIQSVTLGADVALTSGVAATILTVSSLAAGTHGVVASACCASGSGAVEFNFVIQDSVGTLIASARETVAGGGNGVQISLCGSYVNASAHDVKLQCTVNASGAVVAWRSFPNNVHNATNLLIIG